MPRFLLFFLLSVSWGSLFAQTSTIYFEFDKSILTEEARTMLDKLPIATIDSVSIMGHCDQLGSDVYNNLLSEKRAEAVRRYLVNRGLAEDRIVLVKGYGKSQPIVNQLDVFSRKLNRRVIINIIPLVVAEPAKPADTIVNTPVSAPSIEPVKPKPTVKLIDEVRDSSKRAGDNIVLRNINFFGGRHVFLPQSYPTLNELVETMKALPTLVIEIQGHICCLPGPEDGMDNDTGQPFLSYNRARAVYEFLLRNGIEKKRMSYKGFGHRFPIIEIERNEEERTTNRRVEIKIIKK